MLHYFCFGVEPAKDHPKFWELQTGDAHIVIRTDREDCENQARAMIERAHWKIQKLHTSLVNDESHLSSLPPEAQEALRHSDTYFEVVACPTGTGSDEPENPFS
jgi:hypothetical protein